MLRVRTNTHGIERLRNLAGAIELSERDKATTVLRLLDSVHNKQVRRAFASRGATVATGPWPSWSPKYAKWRAKHRGRLGNRMMRYTDSLFEKATSPNHAGHEAIYRGGGRAAMRYAFGFRDDVGYWHHIGAGNLPLRSIIDKTEADRKEFVASFVAFWRAHVRRVLRHIR